MSDRCDDCTAPPAAADGVTSAEYSDIPQWERDLLLPEGSNFSNEAHMVYKDSYAVLLDKHRDYGPDNIARAPGGPLMGLAVRLHDKVARLAHLLENGATPENESLADTFLDITNYGAIGQMVLGGTWPGVTGTKSAEVGK